MKDKKEKINPIEDLTKNDIMTFDNESGSNDLISFLAIQELLNTKKLKSISRIKPDQVSNLMKMLLYADTFKTPFVKKMVDYILELQISINGLGRKELVQLVQKRDDMIATQKNITSKDIFR